VAARPYHGAVAGDLASAGEAARLADLRDLVRRLGHRRSAEPFRLSSGQLSHDYVDLRAALAAGADLRLAAEAVAAHLEGLGVGYDAIGGMTMGADPIAHAVAVVTGACWFSVRKAEKAHGSRRRVEGAEVAGRRVVVVEDTASTGRSALEAVEAVEAAGGRVVHALALLDRGEVAGPAIRARGIAYSSLLTYADLGIEPVLPVEAGTGGSGPTS
jgi:orotate phosphoribosyltransferase